MLLGDKVVLSILRETDKAILFGWINDPELMQWNAPYRIVSWKAHLDWFENVSVDPGKICLGIRRQADDELIGLIQLIDINHMHRSAELRIKLCAEDSRGKGCGSEAICLLLAHAWQDLNLNRVEVRVFVNNRAAISVYEKAGFVFEGSLVQAAFVAGHYTDIVIMAALRADEHTSRDDFTEQSYRRLICVAKDQGYAFVGYRDQPDHRHVIWRHDVDFSIHRALRLAEIEAEEGVQATYFVNPHCAFYNLLEPAILSLVRKIRELGHVIGLHFDADAYPSEIWSAESLERRLSDEKRLLEMTLDTDIAVFSYHNPDAGDLMTYDTDMAGMINAYGRVFREEYTYVSDSNGYWRFRSIAEVLSEGSANQLHILTHPAWWTPTPMPPRDRVLRATHGRSVAIMRDYDRGLEAHGRRNVRR